MTLTFGELAKNSFCDFFHIPDDYPLRIAGYVDNQLTKQEAVKTRQIYAAFCSILNGAAFSIPSHGGTLVICAWAARRLFVATRKLKLIKAELTIRKIELRPFLNRDWMIPVAVAVTGAAIGFGIDFGLAIFVPIGHLSVDGGPLNTHDLINHAVVKAHEASTEVVVDSTGGHSTMIAQEVVQHTRETAKDFFEGFTNQVKDVFSPIHEGVVAANPDGSLTGAMAYLGGAHAAQEVERSIAVLMGSQSLQWMSDKLDFESIRPRVSQQLECKRLPWSTGVLCNKCESPIKHGKFHHCCDCGDEDEFNLCADCYKQDPTCESDAHTMRLMQLAVPGDSYHPEKAAAAIMAIAGPRSLSCKFCDKSITQGWYYDCWDCRQEGPRCVLCLSCYTAGRTCRGEDTHRLYAFPRAVFAAFNADAPYQRKAKPETGRATCKKCGLFVRKGAYYHCGKCDKGTYDLCRNCYQTGEHCRRSDHVLTKFYAWSYKRYTDKSLKTAWNCSNPKCTEVVRTTDFYFSCLDPACKNRQFGLCPACYFADLCCPVKEHDIFKCIFK